MDYAYRGLKNAIETVTLTPDMGEEELHKKLLQIWRGTTAFIVECQEVKEDSILRDAYRVLLDQAQNATTEFRWLDQPELFYSSDKNEKKPNILQYLLLLPTLLLFITAIIFFDRNHYLAVQILAVFSLATFAAYFALDIWHIHNTKEQTGTMYAEQRIHLTMLQNSLEKIARHIDAGVSGLYALLRQKQGEGDVELDGIDLVKRLLKLNYEGEPVPEGVMTEVRLYLNACHMEALEYTPEREAMFTLLPSNGVKTIQPALVQRVKIIKDGEACEQEVLLQMGTACVNMDEMM